MSSVNGNILVTDDDPDLRRVLRRTLDALGFEVAESPNGEQALREVEARQYHAVLLDVNMPGIGGIEACRQIRRKDPRLQILMLTVRDREADKIEALDAGADDYITKPFSIPELAARLRSAVRRSATTCPTTDAPIVIGEIELDPARRIVRKAGAVLRLTPKEFDLLHYLMSHPGIPVAHGEAAASRVGRGVRARTGIPAHVRPPIAAKAGGRPLRHPSTCLPNFTLATAFESAIV